MLNTQSSELAESIQELKNFQVYVRVRPINKDEQQLSSRKSPDRFQRSNLSIQQQQQYSSIYGSSSPHHSPLVSKQNGGSTNNTFNNGLAGQSSFNNSQFYGTSTGFNSVNNQGDQYQNSIIRVDEEVNTVILSDPDYRNIDKREKAFTYDGVLSENSTNYDTFEKAVLPSLSGILEGYNATFFAYGITGSGKTHTIFGRNGGLIKPFNSFTYSITSMQQNNLYNAGSSSNVDNLITASNFQDKNLQDRGICYIAIEYLLQNLDLKNTTLKFSFLEIYNENVRDLLNGQNNLKGLTIIEDPVTKSICVQELKEYQITSIAQIDELIQEGNQRRALAPTSANQFSSRSHAILILTVSQRQLNPITQIEEIITSKLTIIDLAGSEKGSDKPGKGSLEGSNINRSLLTLGNCINILSEKKKSSNQHVPYRDSKLTRILKDTLGGNTKTVMIACISQSYSSLEETINTLNYASRATHIKRKITKNITQELDYFQQKEMIKELQNELAFYKNKYGNGAGAGGSTSEKLGGNATPPSSSSTSNNCENCKKSKKSLFSYDCSNFESVYAKSTAHSSFDTKIKHERQLIQGQILELTEQIKQSLQLENSLGEDLSQESIENQIRIRNEQNGNSEEFLNRICNDLFQNVVESHQLVSSLQEIEELLVQDYQKLLFYQKNPLQTPQVQGIISQLQESIRENEEIREKMKLVLDTNQEQKQNLKYVLLRISNKKQIQMEYDLKVRKQQLDFLDILEVKSDLEKQVTLQNQMILDKEKIISQITQENVLLKSQKNRNVLQKQSQQDILPTSFSAIRTQPDEEASSSLIRQERQNNQLKGMLGQLNSSGNSNNICQSSNSSNKHINTKQAFSQQLLQQEQQQKNQSSLEQVKNNFPNLFTQQAINSNQGLNQVNLTNSTNNASKQKTHSLTPLTKDLLNYDNSNNMPSLHNKGSVSQTSAQLVSSPQHQINLNINFPISTTTPKNDQKSSQSSSSAQSLYGSKAVSKISSQPTGNTPTNQYTNTNNNSSQSIGNYHSAQPYSTTTTQETSIPLTFSSYAINAVHNSQASTYPLTSIPNASSNLSNNLSNSNIPNGLLKQSNAINPMIPLQSPSSLAQNHLQPAYQMYFNSNCQSQGSSLSPNTPTQNQQISGKLPNSYQIEKENKTLYQTSQEETNNNILNAYSSLNPHINSEISYAPNHLTNQQQSQQNNSSLSSSKVPLFTRSKSPTSNQPEINIMNNILEQSRHFAPNIVQSSTLSQQGLISSKNNLHGSSVQNQTCLKREPQNAVIDLFQNSTQLSTSSQGQKKSTHSQQNSGGLFDKFGQSQQLQQQQASSSSSQILNSTGVNNLNNQSTGKTLLSSYKSRSQSKSGRYDNNNSIIEKTKQIVSEKLLQDDKKQFLEEQLYSNNQALLDTPLSINNNNNNNLNLNNTVISNLHNTSLFDNRASNNVQEKMYMISPMDSCKNPMESRDTGLNISTKKNEINIAPLNPNIHCHSNISSEKNTNLYDKHNPYSDFDFQNSALNTPLNPSTYQGDKYASSNPSATNPFLKQARRLINYDMDDFDDDCEPKIMSRRSSDCNGQPSHIHNLNVNDSVTHRNPLETESEFDQDEINASGKKQQNFQNSPPIHKTSRTICTTNVNLKKKNFDVIENEI